MNRNDPIAAYVYHSFASHAPRDEPFASRPHRRPESSSLAKLLAGVPGLGRIYLDKEELNLATDFPVAIREPLALSERLAAIASRSFVQLWP